MNSLTEQPALVFDATWSDRQILDQVTGIADQMLAPLAHAIDHEAYYPLPVMAALARAGAFAPQLDRYGARVGLAIDNMAAISRRCGSTGFLSWCHDVCGMYLEQSGNPALTGLVLEQHTLGQTFGGTALSNPMKSMAGIEKMLLRAVKTAGGYHVSGALPWVSHIRHGQYCGAIATVLSDDGSRSHDIMFLLRCSEDVALRPCPEFSGMEGTSTWGIRLDQHFVGTDLLIADPAQPLIERIRPAFVLLQCGMALGVAQAGIDACLEVEPLLGHVNQYLQDRPDELQGQLQELSATVARLAASPYDGSRDYFLDVLDARAQGAEFALRATQSSLLHQGARGYLRNAAPQRLIREAHFIAIVTPAIKHLRWLMDKSSREVVPA